MDTETFKRTPKDETIAESQWATGSTSRQIKDGKAKGEKNKTSTELSWNKENSIFNGMQNRL
jgi:hypothetical protein